MSLQQIKLNQMQKSAFIQLKMIANNISDEQQQSRFSKHWWKAVNIILLSYFFKQDRVNLHLLTSLRQNIYKSFQPILKEKHLRGKNYPHLLCRKVYEQWYVL